MKEDSINYVTAKHALSAGCELISVTRINGVTVLGNLPTQSLLQRWLREKHYIFTIVDVEEVELFTVSNWEYGEDLFKIKGKFNTYEEALEKGLQEALKLIKI